ncbi:MAG TPA: gamma carbonic anhydrase family protein [Nevskiaceae bacterium]|nr:gamma carbonic anhydrase family protein [Nevskiaceae bacterium]
MNAMLYTLDGHTPKLEGDNFVAHNATLIGRITLERNASVWYGCTLRGDCDDIVVGAGTNVQDGSVLHTDVGIKLRIGANCTIGHMVMLHGCEIGEGSLIGIKSVILNRVKIGKNCLVGACSLITEGKSFPDNSLIMGSPAKLVRELLPHEIQSLQVNAQFYQQNAQRFLKGLKPA